MWNIHLYSFICILSQRQFSAHLKDKTNSSKRRKKKWEIITPLKIKHIKNFIITLRSLNNDKKHKKFEKKVKKVKTQQYEIILNKKKLIFLHLKILQDLEHFKHFQDFRLPIVCLCIKFIKSMSFCEFLKEF